MSYNFYNYRAGPDFFDWGAGAFYEHKTFKIADLITPDHKARFINPMKIIAKPIEISALEKFQVEIKLPDTWDIKSLLIDPPWDWTKTWNSYIAPARRSPIRTEDRHCQCEIAILMRNGCQCGGV